MMFAYHIPHTGMEVRINIKVDLVSKSELILNHVYSVLIIF